MTSKCSNLTFQFHNGEIYYLMFQSIFLFEFSMGKIDKLQLYRGSLWPRKKNGNFSLNRTIPSHVLIWNGFMGICLFFPNWNIPYVPWPLGIEYRTIPLGTINTPFFGPCNRESQFDSFKASHLPLCKTSKFCSTCLGECWRQSRLGQFPSESKVLTTVTKYLR